ncbi:MAG TPA: ATP-binding protein, partial [Actinomycetes bacterium]|nr:ATP-binding protein [Actinomycetes bacterium]
SDDQAQAQRIVDVTERAAELTSQLLVFARREEPATEQVEVNALVRQADALLARTLGEHIERRLELVDRDCVIEVDPARFEQVVLNLAVNARDAMPDGGVLQVRTEVAMLDAYDQEIFRTRAPGLHVILSVADEGQGMDEETRRQAFEPFFTTKPRGQGTGLGLATVYAVSIQAGGGTWIYSEPSRGTVVKVALPLVPDRAAVTGDEPEPPAVLLTGHGRRVVVVEDEAALRDVAERLLVRAGFVVETFPDGASLVDALPRLVEPDVLLTDVVLPGISGPEAAELLRERFPATRIVFMSGYTAGLMGGRQIEGEVLSKPFSSATLVAAIERALGSVDDAG